MAAITSYAIMIFYVRFFAYYPDRAHRTCAFTLAATNARADHDLWT